MIGLFSRYVTVGVLNTVLHWAVFGLFFALGAGQAVANALGFAVAVTFSFFANARFTFAARASPLRYGLYVAFMGALALGIGWMADQVALHPLLTLAAFSLVSLVAGFLFARLVVFGDAR